ncbi:Aste57867_848 [Aphanomyces stellatus]|uniref:Aste57867_848 protein n=1 Tax=Aphanomyces stellatus TaxID=120398 RepID=A0A485K8X4_9STRA|nr:hypothetical protein As57867_000847 [Aphanomyces stellatus]VFT78072.1 Aste57867_848 [Aphanomyces stellatus]
MFFSDSRMIAVNWQHRQFHHVTAKVSHVKVLANNAAMVRSAGRKRRSHGGIRLDSLSDLVEPVNEALSPTKERRAKKSSKLTRDQERLLSSFELAYKELPPEVMGGHDLNLSMWTIVVYDSCLAKIAHVQSQVGDVGSSNQVADERSSSLASLVPTLKQSASSTPPSNSTATLPVGIKLNLQGAEHVRQITDDGMRKVVPVLASRLHSLNISRTPNLTDTLVRWIATTCTNLRQLEMKHLPQLGGPGVGAIGESCSALEVFSVAGCKHIPEFALLKVANGCPLLTSYDISHCHLATDIVLRALSTNCTKLQHVLLLDCKEISDTGVLALSNGCPDLVHINLSRTDFQYKITDMALLSLSERCKILQHVNFSGCDYLTDAGISWLAGGCSALTHINLTMCVKLTDFSLRAIADGCIRLGHLDVSGCQRMSDIGLRYISLGCRDLHTLRLKNTILVSDGMSLGREHAQGIASLSHTCKRLQHLDLTKCIRIDDNACRQISRGFHDLRTLSLLHCTAITGEGVQDLGHHCHKLTHLDLTDCRLVDDAGVSAIGSGMKLLQSLKLRDCEKLSTVAIQHLCAGCRYLHTLDLAGCHKLDDMALLAMSESLTNLQHVWLGGLSHITIIGVSWLADRCTRIMELDVSNSAISYISLKPLRSAWKYGELHERNKSRGIFPKHRAEDMLFLDHYGTCWKSAVQIQCMYRAKIARREAALRREQALIHWAASKMQSIYRGRKARQYAELQRQQRLREIKAATQIKAAYRAHVARTLVARMRKQRERERYIQMVIRVQSAWRQKKAREVFNSKRLLKAAWEQKRLQAANVIQRAFKVYMWRKRNSLYLTAMRVKKEEEQAAANKLQVLFRGRAARLEAQRRRDVLRVFDMRKERAANCLQRVIRRRRERRLRQRKFDHEAKLEAAATRIQKRYRLRRQMLSYQLLQLGREFKARTAAALRLQAAWRRKKGHLAMHMLRVLKDEEYHRRSKAAQKLQARWRGRGARELAAKKLQASLQRLALQVKMENHLATVIQAGWRGKKGRQKHRAAVDLRKRRWKEVPNTDTGKKVYYHQDTGEIRNRIPQDLLDLLPRPRCNDCDVKDAAVECGDCTEFFCKDCWHAIHAGGRRRVHRFRALYDFYGKRIDYGDGEFPSVWPSEIEQDELDGWFLRVSPFREPCLVLGNWEKYVDDKSHREWYFNPKTKISTYLPPDAFKASAEDIAKAWVRRQDAAHHASYYFNERTGQRTFERPPTFVEKSEEDALQAAAVEVEAPSSAVDESLAEESQDETSMTVGPIFVADLGSGWTQYWDESYQVYYYYNTVTQESTYTMPEVEGAVAL